MSYKKIFIGADHAGFKLKEKVKVWLIKNHQPFEDLGNLFFDPQDDYPDYAVKVAQAVVKNKTVGLLACGSAQGMCITANKIKGVRAGIPHSVKEAQLARKHDDVNIICLSGWFHQPAQAISMTKAFLAASFSKEAKRVRRVNKIKRLER